MVVNGTTIERDTIVRADKVWKNLHDSDLFLQKMEHLRQIQQRSRTGRARR